MMIPGFIVGSVATPRVCRLPLFKVEFLPSDSIESLAQRIRLIFGIPEHIALDFHCAPANDRDWLYRVKNDFLKIANGRQATLDLLITPETKVTETVNLHERLRGDFHQGLELLAVLSEPWLIKYPPDNHEGGPRPAAPKLSLADVAKLSGKAGSLYA
jgi:hypothetical protein